MNKLPKLLALLMAPFFMMAVDGEGGGAAEPDRGDNVDPPADADAQAQADADTEAARIEAEKNAGKDAGGDGDGEGDGEGKEGEGKDADGKPPKGKMIPVDRHKAMLDKARAERDALQAQLDQAQHGKAVAATNAEITKIEEQVTAKEEEYNKLLADGETAKATVLMREIRALERSMADAKADMKAAAATALAVEQVRYSTAVDRLEAAYPALNPDHDDFDKEKTAEVMELFDAYKLKGLTPTAALQKAVKLIMGAETTKQTAAVEVTPQVKAAELTAAQRKEAATKAALAAAGKTPPSTADAGKDSDKNGGGKVTGEMVMGMKQEQFAKLNEETLATLRGDVI